MIYATRINPRNNVPFSLVIVSLHGILQQLSAPPELHNLILKPREIVEPVSGSDDIVHDYPSAKENQNLHHFT